MHEILYDDSMGIFFFLKCDKQKKVNMDSDE